MDINKITTMASADQLKALIQSHISRDDSHFYSVAMQVAAHEAKQGHGRLAEELLSILDKGKAKLAASKSGKIPHGFGQFTERQ